MPVFRFQPQNTNLGGIQGPQTRSVAPSGVDLTPLAKSASDLADTAVNIVARRAEQKAALAAATFKVNQDAEVSETTSNFSSDMTLELATLEQTLRQEGRTAEFQALALKRIEAAQRRALRFHAKSQHANVPVLKAQLADQRLRFTELIQKKQTSLAIERSGNQITEAINAFQKDAPTLPSLENIDFSINKLKSNIANGVRIGSINQEAADTALEQALVNVMEERRALAMDDDPVAGVSRAKTEFIHLSKHLSAPWQKKVRDAQKLGKDAMLTEVERQMSISIRMGADSDEELEFFKERFGLLGGDPGKIQAIYNDHWNSFFSIVNAREARDKKIRDENSKEAFASWQEDVFGMNSQKMMGSFKGIKNQFNTAERISALKLIRALRKAEGDDILDDIQTVARIEDEITVRAGRRTRDFIIDMLEDKQISHKTAKAFLSENAARMRTENDENAFKPKALYTELRTDLLKGMRFGKVDNNDTIVKNVTNFALMRLRRAYNATVPGTPVESHPLPQHKGDAELYKADPEGFMLLIQTELRETMEDRLIEAALKVADKFGIDSLAKAQALVGNGITEEDLGRLILLFEKRPDLDKVATRLEQRARQRKQTQQKK